MSEIYSNICNLIITRNSVIPPIGDDPMPNYVRQGYEFPYISTYYFNPMPTDVEYIVIPIYITDYFQKEYYYGYNGEQFKLRVEIDGVVTYKNNLYAGDYSLNLGKLSKGEHWFSLQLEDSQGYLSDRLYNELMVINTAEYTIQPSQTYTVTTSDLSSNNITLNLSSSATETQMQNNRVGLTNLFQSIKNNGYRKCILPKGTYRVNKSIREGTDTTTPISIPTNFTVDLNGATIKMHPYTDEGLSDSRNAMIRFQNCIDSHLVNGTLEGNYAERQANGWASGYNGEGDGCLFINGGAYNTVENVTVKQIAGYNCSHNFGSKHGTYDMVMEDKSLSTWYENIFIDANGNDIAKSGYLTSEMFSLSSTFKNVGWISASIWLRTGQIKGNHWKMYYSFYNSSRQFIETIDSCQFRRCRIPDDAYYVKVTFICTKAQLGTVYLHTQPSARYCAIKNSNFIDNRTCMNPNQFQHLLYENINFTRTGESITPSEIDLEDGWEQAQDFFVRNCKVLESAGAADIIAQTGLNFVIEGCDNLSLDKGAQVYGACYKNNNNVSVNWGVGMYTRNTSRCYNNTNMIDAVGYKWSIDGTSNFFGDDKTKCKFKDCSITYGQYTTGQQGFKDATEIFMLDNCEIDIINTYRNLNVENSTIRIKNGCVQSGKHHYKKCEFNTFSGASSIDLGFWELNSGRIYEECNFNADTNLKENQMWNDGTFKSCNFKGNTTITLTTSRDNNYGDIKFDNCTFEKALNISITGNTKLQFNNCTFLGGINYSGNGESNTQINTESGGQLSEYEKSCQPSYILDKMYPMGQAHEAIPSGNITVPEGYTNWKYNSRWENQYRPTAAAHSCGQSGCPGTGAFKALGCWSNIYRVEGTPFSANTGVEMKDIKVYGWYNNQWELVQHLPVPNGNFYAESFNGDSNQYFADSVKQTSTSKTIMLREKNKIQSENCMYHPFSNIKNFDTKYQYIYTCIDLRKVKWDANGVDDRNQAHYCSNCGGDWWLAEGLMFHDSWQHNKGVCQPKIIEITNEWRRFSMTTVPQSWSYGFPE